MIKIPGLANCEILCMIGLLFEREFHSPANIGLGAVIALF